MSDPHRLHEIRCPVHRFVTINDWEREIINQPAFQRLRQDPAARLDGSRLSRRDAHAV